MTSSTNGSVMYTSAADGNSSYSFNVVAMYSCNAGFSLVGRETLSCTGDGSSTTGAFDGVAPTCEGRPLFSKRAYILSISSLFDKLA